MEPNNYQKDIIDYVIKVLNDAEYEMTKFIPISLPRRTGKSFIANKLYNLRNTSVLRVIDEANTISNDKFFNKLIPWFRGKDTVLVMIFTTNDEDSICGKILKGFPSISGCIVGDEIHVSYPDNTIKKYAMDDSNLLSIEKEAEIHALLELFQYPNLDGL